MKKHLVIIFFYLLFSWFLVESFSRDRSNIDVYILFVVVAMFLGWVLNLSPQIRVWFLFWTLGVGGGLSWYVHQEVLLRGPKQYVYTFEYSMGRGYKVNSTVRNYSINRAREIESAKQRSYSTGGTGYSGGGSHYGGGLSGGK